MKVTTRFFIAATALVCLTGCSQDAGTTAATEHGIEHGLDREGPPTVPQVELATDLAEPIALEAGGSRIDIGTLSSQGHAGPCVADIDCDGDEDLLVGDFPGYFWFFENVSGGSAPTFASAVKLQAGGEDAKVPVY